MKATAVIGPVIWRMAGRSPVPGATRWESSSGCVAFAGVEGWRWHVSVSHPRRVPSWDEMRTAREAMTPDEVTMAMLLPPARGRHRRRTWGRYHRVPTALPRPRAGRAVTDDGALFDAPPAPPKDGYGPDIRKSWPSCAAWTKRKEGETDG